MQSNLTAMITNRNPKVTAISCELVVYRLWQVKRLLNWPSDAEHLKRQ